MACRRKREAELHRPAQVKNRRLGRSMEVAVGPTLDARRRSVDASRPEGVFRGGELGGGAVAGSVRATAASGRGGGWMRPSDRGGWTRGGGDRQREKRRSPPPGSLLIAVASAWVAVASAWLLEKDLHCRLGREISFSGGSKNRNRLKISHHHHGHYSVGKQHHSRASTRRAGGGRRRALEAGGGGGWRLWIGGRR